MFEGVLTALLTRLLGEYVKAQCFTRDKVQASVYAGHVSLVELELRHDALDFLQGKAAVGGDKQDALDFLQGLGAHAHDGLGLLARLHLDEQVAEPRVPGRQKKQRSHFVLAYT